MTTTTTKPTVTKARESYRHPTNFSGVSLEYVLRKNGTHTVAMYLPAGESSGDMPEVWNYPTIEEARTRFANLRKYLAGRGYARV